MHRNEERVQAAILDLDFDLLTLTNLRFLTV